MAGAPPPASATDTSSRESGYRALAPALRRVQWPAKFRPEMTPRYDGATDSALFLLAYKEDVLEARGDDEIMEKLFPLALVGEPRAWLLNLPGSMVAS